LGWIAAPALACILTFVLLFFVQNVFEQPVVNKISYVFNRTELVEMQKLGINLDYLTEVNGHKYDNARDLSNSLNKIYELNQAQKLLVSQVAQLHPMKIEYSNLHNAVKLTEFTDAQWSNLIQLDGKTYDHKWQLEQDLCKLSPDWCYKPKTNKNQLYNNELQRKYKLLFDQFKVSSDTQALN
jgi:PiT family inorganic phosphate transporter